MNMTANDCVKSIFLLASPRGRAEKGRNLQGVVLFVVKYPGRYCRGKELLTDQCEDCGKALCVIPCFQNLSYTKLTTNYMEKILGKGYCRWRLWKMMMIRNI